MSGFQHGWGFQSNFESSDDCTLNRRAPSNSSMLQHQCMNTSTRHNSSSSNNSTADHWTIVIKLKVQLAHLLQSSSYWYSSGDSTKCKNSANIYNASYNNLSTNTKVVEYKIISDYEEVSSFQICRYIMMKRTATTSSSSFSSSSSSSSSMSWPLVYPHPDIPNRIVALVPVVESADDRNGGVSSRPAPAAAAVAPTKSSKKRQDISKSAAVAAASPSFSFSSSLGGCYKRAKTNKMMDDNDNDDDDDTADTTTSSLIKDFEMYILPALAADTGLILQRVMIDHAAAPASEGDSDNDDLTHSKSYSGGINNDFSSRLDISAHGRKLLLFHITHHLLCQPQYTAFSPISSTESATGSCGSSSFFGGEGGADGVGISSLLLCVSDSSINNANSSTSQYSHSNRKDCDGKDKQNCGGISRSSSRSSMPVGVEQFYSVSLKACNMSRSAVKEEEEEEEKTTSIRREMKSEREGGRKRKEGRKAKEEDKGEDVFVTLEVRRFRVKRPKASDLPLLIEDFNHDHRSSCNTMGSCRHIGGDDGNSNSNSSAKQKNADLVELTFLPTNQPVTLLGLGLFSHGRIASCSSSSSSSSSSFFAPKTAAAAVASSSFSQGVAGKPDNNSDSGSKSDSSIDLFEEEDDEEEDDDADDALFVDDSVVFTVSPPVVGVSQQSSRQVQQQQYQQRKNSSSFFLTGYDLLNRSRGYNTYRPATAEQFTQYWDLAYGYGLNFTCNDGGTGVIGSDIDNNDNNRYNNSKNNDDDEDNDAYVWLATVRHARAAPVDEASASNSRDNNNNNNNSSSCRGWDQVVPLNTLAYGTVQLPVIHQQQPFATSFFPSTAATGSAIPASATGSSSPSSSSSTANNTGTSTRRVLNMDQIAHILREDLEKAEFVCSATTNSSNTTISTAASTDDDSAAVATTAGSSSKTAIVHTLFPLSTCSTQQQLMDLTSSEEQYRYSITALKLVKSKGAILASVCMYNGMYFHRKKA